MVVQHRSMNLRRRHPAWCQESLETSHALPEEHTHTFYASPDTAREWPLRTCLRQGHDEIRSIAIVESFLL